MTQDPFRPDGPPPPRPEFVTAFPPVPESVPPPEPPPTDDVLLVPARTPIEERLHPASPLVSMWIGIVALGWFVVTSVLQGDAIWEDFDTLIERVPWWLYLVAGGVLVSLGFGYWSWWTTRFTIDDTELRIENRGAFQESKRIAFSRIQSVDVTQPFAARLLGLAELSIDVGGDAPAKLSFLTRARATELRDYLMVRAHGRSASTTEIAAAERASAWNDLAGHDEVLIKLTPSDLILGALVSIELPALLLALSVPAALAFWFDGFPFLAVGAGLIPLALALFGFISKRVLSQFNYTLARTPAGLRVTRGLLTLKSQTIPAHRVQAIRIAQPLPWRWIGRARIELTVLGLGQLGQDESNLASTVLLPIGRPHQVATALAAVWPGLELDALTYTPVARRARWLNPLSYPWLGYAIDDNVTVSRVGWLTRSQHIVPHARLQSAGVAQGPIQRRVRVATLSLHTSGLLGTDAIPHLDEPVARQLVFDLVDRARTSRADELLHPPGLRGVPAPPAASAPVFPDAGELAGQRFADPAETTEHPHHDLPEPAVPPAPHRMARPDEPTT